MKDEIQPFGVDVILCDCYMGWISYVNSNVTVAGVVAKKSLERSMRSNRTF